jgi:cobalt-zinc-cadmium efflux system outer membrane protein
VLSIVVTVSLAAQAAAQTVSQQEFIAGIGPSHPALAEASLPLAEGQAALRRARALANPVVDAVREDPQEVARQTTLTLSWVPPLDGRRGLGIRAAEAGVAAAEKEVAAARLLLQLEAKAVYVQWAAAAALRSVLAEQGRGVTDLARRVRSRADAGEESELAAGRLELAAADVQSELRAAEAAEAMAASSARAWRPDLPADAVPELPSLDAAAAEPAVLAVEALQRRSERARLEERLAGRFWTFPALQAGWQKQHHDDASGPVFGLTWTIPLFDRNQGARDEARARREAAEARLAWVTTRVASTLEGRRRALEVERVALEEAARAAALAAPVVRAATARFEAGEGTVTELVEAIAAGRSAQRRAVDARVRALAAERAVLAAAAGQAEGGLR